MQYKDNLTPGTNVNNPECTARSYANLPYTGANRSHRLPISWIQVVPKPVELMQCPDHDMPWKFSDSLLGVAQESYIFHLGLYEIMYIETTSM